MADEQNPNPQPDPTPDPEPTPDPQPDPDPDDEVVAQADNPDAVKKALSAERANAKKAQKEAAAALAKLKEIEDRDKSEQDKTTEERDALKAEMSGVKAENLRLRVALEKKVPAELIDRLQGGDREEMEADADKLLALVATTGGARGSADQGARGGGSKQLTQEALSDMSPEEIVKAHREGRLGDLTGATN